MQAGQLSSKTGRASPAGDCLRGSQGICGVQLLDSCGFSLSKQLRFRLEFVFRLVSVDSLSHDATLDRYRSRITLGNAKAGVFKILACVTSCWKIGGLQYGAPHLAPKAASLITPSHIKPQHRRAFQSQNAPKAAPMLDFHFPKTRPTTFQK